MKNHIEQVLYGTATLAVLCIVIAAWIAKTAIEVMVR